jgi:type VI secretion system protein ImpI
LIDRSGRTYINSSSQPVGRGRRARLNHGDTLTIGRYRMRAELNGEAAVNSGMEEDAGQHRQLVDVAEGSLLRSESGQALPDGREPLEGLHTPAGEPISEDPLAPWPNTQERQGMSESTEQSREAKDTSRQHISGAPLMRGMEAEIDFADSDEMRLFLEEAGQTLKATVEGLLALHQGEDSRHRALRTRLQPIEDNPLRLGDDYTCTMQTLFAAERSPVHLSAPAAVRESLESLNHHQQATREAIREALEAILYAFSPEALLRRFHGYRRGLQDNEDEGRWAWNMYQHYYRELRSSRQQGFERLFQEVFDQAYDQHLRQLQRENV